MESMRQYDAICKLSSLNVSPRLRSLLFPADFIKFPIVYFEGSRDSLSFIEINSFGLAHIISRGSYYLILFMLLDNMCAPTLFSQLRI